MDFLIHHICTLGAAVITFIPFAQYYTLFSGLAEITNVILSFYDGFQYLGDDYKNKFPKFYKLCQISFGISFYIIRLIYWPYKGFSFFSDSIKVILSNEESPVRKDVIAFILVLSLLLTFLQFYWGWLIFAKFFVNKKTSKK